VLEEEVLLRDKLAEFVAWQGSLQYVPAISQLQAKFESVRASELEKAPPTATAPLVQCR